MTWNPSASIWVWVGVAGSTLGITLAQMPSNLNPQEYIRMVDTMHTWDGYMWACGIVVAFAFVLLVGGWYAIRAAKAVVQENRSLNERYTSALEKYAALLATYTQQAQDLTREHQAIIREQQNLDRTTNELIRADTAATNLSAKRSEEQTKALDQLKETVQRMWERGVK